MSMTGCFVANSSSRGGTGVSERALSPACSASIFSTIPVFLSFTVEKSSFTERPWRAVGSKLFLPVAKKKKKKKKKKYTPERN